LLEIVPVSEWSRVEEASTEADPGTRRPGSASSVGGLAPTIELLPMRAASLPVEERTRCARPRLIVTESQVNLRRRRADGAAFVLWCGKERDPMPLATGRIA